MIKYRDESERWIKKKKKYKPKRYFKGVTKNSAIFRKLKQFKSNQVKVFNPFFDHLENETVCFENLQKPVL